MRSKYLVKIVSSVVALVLVLLLWVLIVSEPDDGQVARSPLLGQPAPAIVTATIDDQPFDLLRSRV